MKFAIALFASVINAESVLSDDLAANSDEYYNLLTIDGGGIRGLIPAKVILKMEEYAWDYATNEAQNYEFPKFEGHDGHFAMSSLFDMVAGTSTGSILAAGLAYPDVNNTKLVNQNINKSYQPEKTFIKPAFFASKLIEIYSKQGDQIFVSRYLGWVLPVSIVLTLLVFGSIGYKLGVHFYDNPKTEKSFKDLSKAISNAKRENKQ